jgi:hypothetical protein
MSWEQVSDAVLVRVAMVESRICLAAVNQPG